MRHLLRNTRSQKGMSLPEVLMSCLISTITIGAILSCFINGRLASAGAQHFTQAVNVARSRMEYLKSLPYAELSTLPSTATESNLALDDNGEGGFLPCNRTTILTQEGTGINVDVVVSWNERSAGAGSTPWAHQLKTWVARPRLSFMTPPGA